MYKHFLICEDVLDSDLPNGWMIADSQVWWMKHEFKFTLTVLCWVYGDDFQHFIHVTYIIYIYMPYIRVYIYCFPYNNIDVYLYIKKNKPTELFRQFLRRYSSLTNNPSRKAEKAEREQAILEAQKAEKMQQAVGGSKVLKGNEISQGFLTVVIECFF